MFLQVAWFVIIVALASGYAVLAGFDLGVGILYPFLGRGAESRSALRRIVGPYWDGNEVWLIVLAGALFAAFPPVYGAVLSGFYGLVVLTLLAVVLRAASLGLSQGGGRWEWVWDAGLFLGSLAVPFLLGAIAGGLVSGVRLLGPAEALPGGPPLSAYSALTGALAASAFAFQGASWAALKAREGGLAESAGRARTWATAVFAGLAVFSAAATLQAAPERARAVFSRPLGWLAVAALVLSLVGARAAAMSGRDRAAFAGSSLAVASLVATVAVSLFPALVPSATGAPLTAYNASSSQLSLAVMLAIAAIGMPVVIGYTAMMYRLFRGRVGAAGPRGYSQ